MTREIYFLDHPNEHVAYRDARIARLKPGDAIARWEEELLGTVAAYSRGDDLETVKLRFDRAVDAVIEASFSEHPVDVRARGRYHLVLWTLSLALVTGLESEKIAGLVLALDLAGKDALLDLLLKVARPDLEPTATFLHEGPFHFLTEASALPGEAGGEKVQAYLLAYLAELEKLPWYGTHLKQLPEFFGYWAFEVAAVVKAFHITDRLFADHIFYPRDLVHQRLFRTWMDNREGERDRREMESALDDEEADSALNELAAYFQQHYGGDGKSLPDALNLLSRLSGSSAEELKDDPDKMREIVTRIFRGVIKANQGLQQTLGGKELSPEAEALIRDLKLDPDLSEEPGPDLEAVRKEAEASGQPAEKIGDRYDKISEHLAKTLEKEKEGQLAFVEGLEMLVTALGMSIAEDYRDIKKEVSEKVAAQLREARKGRTLEGFDWSSLMPKKDPE